MPALIRVQSNVAIVACNHRLIRALPAFRAPEPREAQMASGATGAQHGATLVNSRVKSG